MTTSVAVEELYVCALLGTRSVIEGVDFTDEALTSLSMSDVVYSGCNFGARSFYTSELDNVTFKNCNFRRSLFNMTSFYNSQFINCDVTEADFYCSEIHRTAFSDTPLHDAKLFHALVPDSLVLPAGYTRDRRHNAPANPSLVLYDPLWIAQLPSQTGASPGAAALLLEEHQGETPNTIAALLRALVA